MNNTKQELTALNCMSLRSLIDKVNALGIQKNQIVDIVYRNETFSLLYYRDIAVNGGE